MASDKAEHSDSAVGTAEVSPTPAAPENHDDEREKSLARYATLIGIVTGLFGMLLGVGFVLLPSATMQEKVLIIGASLAASVAGSTAADAWRGLGGFGLTLLAGGLAIACLADLSIVAADGAKARNEASAGHRVSPKSGSSVMPTSSSSATATTTPSSTTSTRSVTQSTQSPSPPPRTPAPPSQPGTVYLFPQPGLTVSDPSHVAPGYTPWTMGGTSYPHSIVYDGNEMCPRPQNASVTFDLSGSYSDFLANVGVAAGSSYESVAFIFGVFAANGSGQFHELQSTSAQAGHPSQLAAAIPAGTKELQLRTAVAAGGGCVVGSIVWGSARLRN
jgi:hypothetical protein